MDSHSQETLRRIEQNNDTLIQLSLGGNAYGRFTSSDASDYSRLGAAIRNNTHLTKLRVYLGANQALDISNNEFFDGLKRNTSINDLELSCGNQTLVGGMGHEILKSYQKINNNLTRLSIEYAVLENGGGNVISETLRWCRNLKIFNLGRNNITDEQLLPIVDAIKGGCYTSLEQLYLGGNMIGNAGCHAIATLLEHTNSNLQILYLVGNQIGNEGATAIANSLANNTKLRQLYLRDNPFDPSAVGIFCRALCNTASVNTTYCSNHTLEKLVLPDEQQGQHANHLASLLDLNRGENKSHVAIKKILKYHPNIDMEPLFEWGVEDDGEHTLNALPFVIDWFERAEEAVADEDRLVDDEDGDNDVDDHDYCVDKKKLSAIFQITKAMPLLFVPASHVTKVNDKKRKREEV